MMHSKHTKHGFTLIEVLLSIAMIGMLLVPIFITQGTMLLRVNTITRTMRAFFEYELLLEEARVKQGADDKQFTLEKPIDNKSRYVYDLHSIDQQSALAKIPGLLIETVSVKSTAASKNSQPLPPPLVTLLFKPERKSDDKKGSHTS